MPKGIGCALIIMKLFQPKRVFIEENALNYPLGIKILNEMNAANVPVKMVGSHNRITGIPGNNPTESYLEGKQTLVVGVKRDLRFESCRPSADFEFSLATSCPGNCQYCYLQTNLGKKPYLRIYVNTEAIFDKIKEVIQTNQSKITTFEAASTSDPLAVEHLTGSLAAAINLFGTLEFGRLRVVTKFNQVEPLLNLNHQQHTKFRFSLNTSKIINLYEHQTASFHERIAAAQKMTEAGYPLGFIIAPLFIYNNSQDDYEELFHELSKNLGQTPAGLTFELITHRFTGSAKKVILERFPNTSLELDETNRRRKYGKYGLIKYLYPETEYQSLKEHMFNLIQKYFPTAKIEYFT